MGSAPSDLSGLLNSPGCPVGAACQKIVTYFARHTCTNDFRRPARTISRSTAAKCRVGSAEGKQPAAARLVERGNAMLDGKLDEPGDVADLQLLHQAAAIGIHSLRREMKRRGDLGA